MTLHHRLIGLASRAAWRLFRPRTIGVRALLLDPEGRIALVRHTYMPGWYLPGGGVRRGESATAAIRRELLEEVAAAEVAIDRVHGVFYSRREGKDDYIVVYVVRSLSDAAGLRPADRIEVAEAGWFSSESLPADVSPATMRRISEHRAGIVTTGEW